MTGLKASMGPQLYRCGNNPYPGKKGGWSWGLQWGRNFIVAETARWAAVPSPAPSCFNGAATLSLRKPTCRKAGCTSGRMLQWGRNFIVAETRQHLRRLLHSSQASMGPQLYRCGNLPHAAACPGQGNGFNGAATLSLRKHAGCYADIVPYDRFNGAATLSLRKLCVCMTAMCSISMLQWGRNFIVAETWPKERPFWNTDKLQWGRNFIVAETCVCGALFECKHRLQWGRNFIVAETRRVLAKEGVDILLQWGRNFIVAETVSQTGGKTSIMTMLQWGRNFIVAETGAVQLVEPLVGPASMGPQLYRCGNWISCRTLPP